MPRGRMVKPEFWDDEKLCQLPRDVRLLYIGTWNFSDDYGVVKGNAVWLKSKIFPYDTIQIQQFEKWLEMLERPGFISPFTHNGEKFYYLPNFSRHQTIDRPSKTRNPEPPEEIINRFNGLTSDRTAFDESAPSTQLSFNEQSTNDMRALNDDSTNTRRGLVDKEEREREIKYDSFSYEKESSHALRDDAPPGDRENENCKAEEKAFKAEKEPVEGQGKGGREIVDPSGNISSDKAIPVAPADGDEPQSVEYSPEVIELNEILIQAVLKNNPETRLRKPQNLAYARREWPSYIEKLLRIDERTVQEVRAVITFSQTDKFWRSNILSSKKLREKWDTLVAQMNEQRSNSHAGTQRNYAKHSAKIPGSDDREHWLGGKYSSVIVKPE